MISDLILAGIIVLGFGILFQAPKKSLPFLAFTGFISFSVFSLLSTNHLFAIFIASLSVGVCSEFFARVMKLPATVFIISGIIPLVPGIPAYNAIFHLLNEDYIDGVNASVDTLLSGGAIALAIAITTTLARSYKKRNKQ